MKIGIQVTCAAGLMTALLSASATDTQPLTDQKSKVSYSIGVNIGKNLKSGGYDVDLDIMQSAMKDVLSGKDLRLTDEQMREAMSSVQQELRAKRDEERKKTIAKNHKEADDFLAANKTKEGVKTHTVTMPDGTTAELQYKVINEGSGPMPKSTDTVSVTYRGTLINGTEFDSTAKHGNQPTKLPATSFVRGWTEALQMMKTGAKWQLFLPPVLAYGDRGSGQAIEPGAALLFDIELLNVEAPAPPPAPAQPLTSDIIRVPSAEELKAGAKIEVLKPEDVERQIRAATNKPAKP
jgi:FKBP-type peptidyl-prolyl cis-trans isomerase FklB